MPFVMRNPIQSCSVLAALVLSASLLTSAAVPAHSGIQGQSIVYISYGTPVQIAPGVWIGIPSVHYPVPTAFTILNARNGHTVGRFTTDPQGAFNVPLHPGKYVLVPEPYTLPFGCTTSHDSIEVTVTARNFVPASIFYFRQGPCIISGTSP